MSVFKLPDLPYAYDALEPHIDAKTIEIHHDKHHATYVNKLNAAIEGKIDFKDQSIEKVLSNLKSLPDDIRSAVRNHGGGHANHALYWTCLSGKGGGEPKGKLAAAITRDFGSFAAFKEKLTLAATNQFGSGWGWLSVKSDKTLCVCATLNQDSPIMDVAACPGIPILTIDVWEHAYYLKYQNRRPDYVSAIWNVINWAEVDRKYQEAIK